MPALANGKGGTSDRERSAGHLSGVTPEGSLYWDEGVFRAELEKLFYRNWLLVGRDEQVPRAGDYLTRQVGGENVIVLRDRRGTVRAFHNVCRHRGTRLVEAESGSGLRSIVCPYHAWTYGLDGRLTGAAHMDRVEGFRPEENGLFPVAVERWGGFLWVNLASDPTPIATELGPFFERFSRFHPEELRAGPRHTYEIRANWKLLVENYSECYHCAPIHPELNRITPYLSGENDAFFTEGEPRAKFAGGFQTFAKDYASMTVSGYTDRPPLRGMTGEDRKRIYYYVLFPNAFFSLHPDYLMVHRTWPVSPSQSVVENDFYFDPATMARPGFDPTDAVQIWDTINRQDWHACELAQLGTRSRVWHGGRYSQQERLVWDFDAFYLREMGFRRS